MVLGYNAYNLAIMPNNGLITDHNGYQFQCDREPVVNPLLTNWSGVRTLPGHPVMVQGQEIQVRGVVSLTTS